MPLHKLRWLEVKCYCYLRRYFLFEPTWCVGRSLLLLGLQALQAHFGFILVILCLDVKKQNKDQALDNGSIRSDGRKQNWHELLSAAISLSLVKGMKSLYGYGARSLISYGNSKVIKCVSICTIVRQQAKVFVTAVLPRLPL